MAEANAAKRDIERIVRAWCEWRDAGSETAGEAPAKKRAARAKKASRPGRQ
jgi:hypothetical protein